MAGVDSMTASGIPGAAPMADPTEPRHQHHYTFAFRGIPSLVFGDDGRMFAAIACTRGEVARQIWKSTGGSESDAEQIMVTLVRLLTHDVAVITMPPVKQCPEAIFVGIARPHGAPESNDESSPLRVFFLEAGVAGPVLGEVTADGRHGSQAKTCKPELEHFVALLDHELTA